MTQGQLAAACEDSKSAMGVPYGRAVWACRYGWCTIHCAREDEPYRAADLSRLSAPDRRGDAGLRGEPVAVSVGRPVARPLRAVRRAGGDRLSRLVVAGPTVLRLRAAHPTLSRLQRSAAARLVLLAALPGRLRPAAGTAAARGADPAAR